jgi:tRNA threonylcarbamoyladenosine biosynthesis protein TsaB
MLLHADGEVKWPPFVTARQDLCDRLAAIAIEPVAAGSGALRFRGELEAAGVEVLPDSEGAHRLSARRLCVLAESLPAMRPEDVRPMYLRAPDAERWLERDRGEA